jgi:hypothetical protein
MHREEREREKEREREGMLSIENRMRHWLQRGCDPGRSSSVSWPSLKFAIDKVGN